MLNVSLAFPTLNIIESRGEKWVRKSFEGIQGQSDDILVVDYSSNDKQRIENLSKSYGFRFFSVPKTPNIFFYMSKLTNKGIIEAKYDLFARASPDIILPKNYVENILNFYKNHDPKKIQLRFNVKMDKENRTGSSEICYRPYLLKARGLDERTSWYLGEHNYWLMLMARVFKLKKHMHPNSLLHRCHKSGKRSINTQLEKKAMGYINPYYLIQNLQRNFNKAVKKVKNSYW